MIRGGRNNAGRAALSASVVSVVQVSPLIADWTFSRPVDGSLAGFNLEVFDALSPGNYQGAIGVSLVSPGVLRCEYASDMDDGYRVLNNPQLLIGTKPVRLRIPVAAGFG